MTKCFWWKFKTFFKALTSISIASFLIFYFAPYLSIWVCKYIKIFLFYKLFWKKNWNFSPASNSSFPVMFYSATSLLKWGKDIPLYLPSQVFSNLLSLLWIINFLTFWILTPYRPVLVIHIMLKTLKQTLKTENLHSLSLFLKF